MTGDARPPPGLRPRDIVVVPVILVVDDEQETRRLARAALEKHGFRVVSAPDASAALAILRAIIPDVLFTDIVMPGGLNGLQLAEAARELHPSMKVVITTGYDFRLNHRFSGERDQVLRKPYRAHQLVAEIENALAS